MNRFAEATATVGNTIFVNLGWYKSDEIKINGKEVNGLSVELESVVRECDESGLKLPITVNKFDDVRLLSADDEVKVKDIISKAIETAGNSDIEYVVLLIGGELAGMLVILDGIGNYVEQKEPDLQVVSRRPTKLRYVKGDKEYFVYFAWPILAHMLEKYEKDKTKDKRELVGLILL